MNKKLLCCALLGALGLAQTATAQEYDDRWYVSGDVGVRVSDTAREAKDSLIYKVGVGKFVAPQWSWELGLNSSNPGQDAFNELNWSLYGVDLTGRYHWIQEGRDWWPYFAFGVGALRHAQETPNLRGGRPLEREGTELETHAGFGLQMDLGRADLRAELGARYDFDDRSGTGEDGFLDYIGTIGVVVALGPEPQAAVTPDNDVAPDAPPVTTCADLDDDGDGVNNCDDKCPNSTAGQTIGPDGCPVPVTIDLRGVNFDFDKSTLRPDAVATLDEAVSVLKQYPDLRVEVAGHTDSKGTDEYNQSLSERRAAAVYDYLTSNGIDAGRLVGPNGYGESRPIAPNTNDDGSDNPDGRAQNRRTELNVQN
jgi:OOP family OmpA-OmpF porin